MASSVEAQWNGHNYQARVFWNNAVCLMDDEAMHVVEVTFEADAPKAFDDVVVRYDPPIPGPGPERIAADYHQVKWHVTAEGRFGYKDLVDPSFIGATAVSLLQRLMQAKSAAPKAAQFTFITTDRIIDGDPLSKVLSSGRTLLGDRLFDGTKTDRSEMGQVRKLWREHLGLTDDEGLREVLSGFRIFDGHKSLDEMRQEINLRLRMVGMLTCSMNSDFRYDELARQMKIRGIGGLTRAAMRKLCDDEGLLRAPAPVDEYRSIAIRSFAGTAADIATVPPADTMLLTAEFNERYLEDGTDWQRDIRPRVEAFLQGKLGESSKLRLLMDAHASLAFLAGTVLGFKSGASVELLQKGRVGSHAWRPDDGRTGPALAAHQSTTGTGGQDIALIVSLARNAEPGAADYASRNLPAVGTTLHFLPTGGPGQGAVAGGEHAAAMAAQVATVLEAASAQHPDATTHVFVAGPNAFMFFLGQHRQGMGPCIIYEWDFDRKGSRSYQPSFLIG